MVICTAKAVQQIVEEIEKAKNDDGKVDADEVLLIIKTGVNTIIDCFVGTIKNG